MNKADEMAEIVKQMTLLAKEIDVEYLRKVSLDWRERANLMDSAAPLITGYTPLKAEALSKRAKALDIICDFAEISFDIGMTDLQIITEQAQRKSINEIFGF